MIGDTTVVRALLALLVTVRLQIVPLHFPYYQLVGASLFFLVCVFLLLQCQTVVSD
jgi:hypothetical protein